MGSIPDQMCAVNAMHVSAKSIKPMRNALRHKCNAIKNSSHLHITPHPHVTNVNIIDFKYILKKSVSL